MWRLTIPGRLPGTNEMIHEARAHKFSGARHKKHWTQICMYHLLTDRIPVFSTPIRLIFRWIEKDKRRDLDNVAGGIKFVLDALVESGRLPNDSRRWIKGIVHEWPEPDPQHPRIEVLIEPA